MLLSLLSVSSSLHAAVNEGLKTCKKEMLKRFRRKIDIMALQKSNGEFDARQNKATP